MKINKKIVFFFDRDGVLNKDLGHVWKSSQFKFLPQTKKVLKFLSKHRIKNYVISIILNAFIFIIFRTKMANSIKRHSPRGYLDNFT